MGVSSSSSGSHTDSSSSSDDAEDVQARVTNRRPHPRASTITAARNTRGSGKKQLVTRQQQQQQKRHRHPNAAPLNPYDALRVPPPNSTHATGVDARTFADYRMSTPPCCLGPPGPSPFPNHHYGRRNGLTTVVAGHQKVARCGSYSCYLDEAFVLVGFRQPSYFRPDMSKAACIYIGWLLTAGILDSVRGGAGEGEAVAYPYVEYLAVRELQRFVDGAGVKELHEVVYPVVILGMFEVSFVFFVCVLFLFWLGGGLLRESFADEGECRCFGSVPGRLPISLLSRCSSSPGAGCIPCPRSCRTSSSCQLFFYPRDCRPPRSPAWPCDLPRPKPGLIRSSVFASTRPWRLASWVPVPSCVC